jgi:tetratricopeptide (TPR) repeat protein
MFFWVVMLLGSVWVLQRVNRGEIKSPFEATPVPTRSAQSYVLEGDASFSAGKVEAAITAYEEALEVDPNNAEIWAKLARIQTYSSAFLITNEQKKARLLEALASADRAVQLAPESSNAHAIRAFTLDWNADSTFYTSEEVEEFLAQAETEALVAQRLDNTNTLALAYYAEILIDQDRWDNAGLIMQQVLERPDASQWMDVYRVNAGLLETLGDYNLAISEYEKALALEPNFTFLYLRIGANYRRLALDEATTRGEEAALPVYEQSLEYFEKAARINEQIGVNDPLPYLSISSTYSQLGEFFIAARNVQKALSFEPRNPDVYGRLGVIYYRSRNYEGSRDTLKCVVYGCSGVDSCIGRGLDKCYPNLNENPVVVPRLELAQNTMLYYYIYGSVLAGLSRPKDNRCEESGQIMQLIRTELETNPDDYKEDKEIILRIVEEGEFICNSLAEEIALGGSPTPTAATAEPGEGMSEITATPTATLLLLIVTPASETSP